MQDLDVIKARLEERTVLAVSRELFESTVRQLEGERDRARALAAHLEEVVAMRTLVLKALVDFKNVSYDRPAGGLMAICEWAEAQLSEIP